MRRYILIAMVVAPLLAAGATSEQTPSFDPGSGFSFSSDEAPGGTSYLGVDTRDITPDRVSTLKLKDESGVEVTMVDQDAPAGKAGIKEHDVILTINGNKIESVEQLRRVIHEIPPGRVVNVGLSRDGQPLTVQAQLAGRHASHAFNMKIPPMPPMPAMPAMPEFDVPVNVVVVHSAMRSGLMVENLTPQLGDFFGAKNGQGVLVRSVEKGSRAEKAGFHAGDVIVRVDKDPVHDTGDFSHALQSHRNGGSVSVGIIREKREQNITLSLPERKQSGDLFEESFEFPDIDIQADLNLDQLTTELANLRPTINLAIEKANREVERLGKDACEQKKQMRKQQKELQKQQLELQKQMRQQGREIQKAWNKEQRELQRELRELQRSVEEI